MNARGFTLIETLVALLVVAIAYTGVASAVSSFADQRLLLVERHSGHRIAWNRLLEQRLLLRGVDAGELAAGEGEGVVSWRGGDWHWQLSEEQAAGQSLRRYQVDVVGPGNQRVANLAAFFSD